VTVSNDENIATGDLVLGLPDDGAVVVIADVLYDPVEAICDILGRSLEQRQQAYMANRLGTDE
jgi:hypothetical protein